eukprot:GHVQ01016661.1.p2 GENE.GHVQ01016661.1~~GHVQ01016661.1.p2  ORF type:complete len:273 (-),score=39.98 GHVQ01016661.1:3364-4182(-)
MDGCTAAVLLLEPDFDVCWRYRESQLLYRLLDTSPLEAYKMLLNELHLSRLVLDGHPKSGEAWAYRRFLLRESLRCHRNDITSLYTEETKFVECQATSKRQFHYHAMSHWSWLVYEFMLPCSPSTERKACLDKALEFITKLSGLCPAHFGVWQQLANLMENSLRENMRNLSDNKVTSVVVDFLTEQLSASDTTLELFPDLEACWEYRYVLLKLSWKVWKEASADTGEAASGLRQAQRLGEMEINTCRKLRERWRDSSVEGMAGTDVVMLCRM